MKLCLVLAIAAVILLSACTSVSNPSNCASFVLTVGPATATADHLATPPGNSVQFGATESWQSNGNSKCAIPLYIVSVTNEATWSVSDPNKVTISNAPGTKGLATCLQATDTPVTVTATAASRLNPGTTLTGTATLTCSLKISI